MRTIGHWALIPLAAILLWTTACNGTTSTPTPEIVPLDQANERISITNNETSLENRIRITSENVPIDLPEPGSQSNGQFLPAMAYLGGPGGSYLSLAGAPRLGVQPASDITLTLVAEVSPPIASGQVLQATSVDIKGKYAYVSYNMVGEPFLGAIDVFNIDNPKKPKLVSQAIFLDSDIHSLTFYDDKVYAAEGTGASGYETPAVWEVIKTKRGKLVLEENERIPLPSYAGTSAVVSGKYVYVTSGNTGGLSVFSKANLELVKYIDLSDARWVDIEDNRVVVVQGGSPSGSLSVLDEDTLSLLHTFTFTGADIPESKSTIQVMGGKAFIAAGRDGVQILSIETGHVVGTVPRPVVPDLDESVVVTNAVSVDEDIMFISNGEAGVYLAQAAKKFEKTGSDEPQDMTLLGKLRFNNLQSVNHVEYDDNVLFVAAGLGGLKIVTVEEPDEGDDEGKGKKN